MAKTPTTTFRLSAHEKQALGDLAQDAGMSVNAVIVKLVREVVGAGPHLLTDDLSKLDEASQQLAAIGRNLNQIVRAMHSNPARTITIDTEYLATLKAHVDQVAIAFSRAIEAQRGRWAPFREKVVGNA